MIKITAYLTQTIRIPAPPRGFSSRFCFSWSVLFLLVSFNTTTNVSLRCCSKTDNTYKRNIGDQGKHIYTTAENSKMRVWIALEITNLLLTIFSSVRKLVFYILKDSSVITCKKFRGKDTWSKHAQLPYITLKVNYIEPGSSWVKVLLIALYTPSQVLVRQKQ